ncbi:hypothetical protein Kpol_538p23 [Vanderwaltozyma polyspora DSM 70294]|uniref:Clathrin light chain n=1 Tax=Vanderwaltozyma polyspora (strain ATCC 22028 / DSM 70294 / BCRC 21397 / CBS 2163 / NBRC 10782 / NRRL Y-8283 / UCD 57-17) TaxID=436907 RepID=A7TKD6_VANPO|nr:uncharacterized protein Kpol_538p23 [Vanderwaltozyma polyspora DSM 70294]EDO17263.1 hypothetical protein Kpol_538p23 [Vanderwaltozyma polyspora DSM 70294]
MSEESLPVEQIQEGTVENDTVEDFEKQFPDVDNVGVAANSQSELAEDDFAAPQSAVAEGSVDEEAPKYNTQPSEAINQWRERHDLEISDRDRKDEQEKVELQEDAIKHIDNFYDEYNRKKQQNLDSVKEEAEKYLKERNEFFEQDNTVWDRVFQLINVDDANVISGRDRSKFKEILQKLKGNTSVPGA